MICASLERNAKSPVAIADVAAPELTVVMSSEAWQHYEVPGSPYVIHVDGASGAFVWPFLYPDSKWDFQLEQVRSINVSGHKYGLVYPGIGWLVFYYVQARGNPLAFPASLLTSGDPVALGAGFRDVLRFFLLALAVAAFAHRHDQHAQRVDAKEQQIRTGDDVCDVEELHDAKRSVHGCPPTS